MKNSHLITLLLLSALSMAGPQALAETTTAVEGTTYDINKLMADNLQILVGKRITVTLHAGVTMTGQVKDVSNFLLHLEKLDGKEYFDALISVDDISAIETRFRK